jgi:hypothetical protein
MGGPTPTQLRAADTGYSYAKTLEDASGKASPVKRGGVMYPSDVATAAAKKGNEPLLRQALDAQTVFGNTPNSMDKVGNVLRAVGAGYAGHAVAGGVALPAAAISLLGAHPVGRLVLLGQYPVQRFLAEYPNIAAQVGRAMAQSQAPQAVPAQ